MAIDGFLCHECIGDKFLKSQIEKDHTAHVCSGCKKNRKAMPLDQLGAALDEVIRGNFVQVEPNNEWEGGGDDLNWIVQEILSVEPEIADLVIEALPEEDVYHILKDGGTPFYDDAAEYRETPAYDGEYRWTWRAFCHNVKHTARFFSDSAESRLREIFHDLDRFHADDGRKPLRLLSPSENGVNIYRARLAETPLAALPIVRSAPRELGPPPEKKAVPGRMNPAGIPVFYGALDIETCISEIRPPVGSLVVIGTFALLKPLRVLDLTVLDEAYAELSYFAPDFDQVTEQLAFLRSFHAEISSPILPSEQVLAFIPTQVIAEFLAHRHEPKLDGVLYTSTQRSGEGLNIALFYHASMVEGSGTEKDEEGDDAVTGELTGDDSFVISEPVKPAAPAPGGRYSPMPLEFERSLDHPHSDIERQPTIRLVPESIRMFLVTGTQYKHKNIRITDLRGFKPGGGAAAVEDVIL